MAITEIGRGDEVTSTVLNNNFEDLDTRISNMAESVATMSSTISTVNSTLNSSIETLNSSVVKLTGSQTISGSKTFTGSNTHQGNSTFTGNTTFSGKVNLSASISGSDDSTRAATTAWVNDRIPALLDTNGSATSLLSSQVAQGDITLSEDFTNYHQIVIVGTNEDGSFADVRIMQTYWLDYLLSHYKSVNIFDGANSYWAVNGYNADVNPSTKKKLRSFQENCVIKKVFGCFKK